MNKRKWFLVTLLSSSLMLAACGGGGGSGGGSESSNGGDMSPELVVIEPLIDESLLDRPDLIITSENASRDVLQEVVFGLEFLREIVSAVASSPLISNIAHNITFEVVSSDFSDYHCKFILVDNDNSNDLSKGDRVAADFRDCPEVQLLSGILNGPVDITIITLVNNADDISFKAEVNLNQLVFTSSDDVSVEFEGGVLVESRNPDHNRRTDIVETISSKPGQTVQFSIGDSKLVFVEPMISQIFYFDIPTSDLSMSVGLVADSTLAGNYRCPKSTLSFVSSSDYPDSGALVRCEGEDSFASLEVLSWWYELANLVVNEVPSVVEWSEFGNYRLAEAFASE